MSAAPRDVTLITGASVGIGADLARVFAQHGHDLALVARNGARMEALADEIVAAGARRPLIIEADLSVPGAADALIALAGGEKLKVDLKATSDVTTPFGIVPMSINEDGDVDVVSEE